MDASVRGCGSAAIFNIHGCLKKPKLWMRIIRGCRPIRIVIRQADVVGRLKLYCCPFFSNPLFTAVAQRTRIKSIPEVRS